MNAQIQKQLEENRTLVISRFEKMLRQAEIGRKSYITSKKFFFEVIADYFESLSTVKVNKIIKGGYVVFIRELNAAIDKAEYACAKPQRELNRL